MTSGPPLSIPELRRSSRQSVDLHIIGEHLTHGDMKVHITNISMHGFMLSGASEGTIAFGDRMIVRLPVIGRIEAYCMWLTADRAGFQFERVIRPDDFAEFIKQSQTARRTRARQA